MIARASSCAFKQTVEGLSVVAISYYLVGLFSYVAKAAYDAHWIGNANLATALFVPFSILLGLVGRAIRSAHFGKDGKG